MNYFSTQCQLQLSIFQNRCVLHVPCVIGMHRIYVVSVVSAVKEKQILILPKIPVS